MNILITGASSGIGAELAKHYAELDHQVYACGCNQTGLKEVAG